MTRALILEDFDGGLETVRPASDSPPPDPARATSETADAAYERGYRAGWDDCELGQKEARSAVSAELSRNIQELGFTYHEARAHVMSGIEPLLRTLIGKVLPEVVAATIGPAILEELAAVAETAADAPVTILVSPESHDTVAEFLAESTSLPFRLVAEPTLGEWQVFFRLGDHERRLDLTEVLDRILARLSAFTDQNEKVLKHG
jgi:flagellar assembly protein FliH